MRILVIGSGGREHALVWKIAQSNRVERLYCATGNPGIAGIAECVDIKHEDIAGLLNFAKENRIDLTVVGPELPLTLGISDEFEEAGLRVFGPHRIAAQIEGSKVFAKVFMDRWGIPTAQYKVFYNPDDARAYVEKFRHPLVIKADGLAGGKGVIVCPTVDVALSAIDLIMVEKPFGEAGSKVVVEDCLVGEEASFLAITDGKTILPLEPAQDHKTLYDDNHGPNTGGMGAYSPAGIITDDLKQKILKNIMIPAIEGMKAEGRPYKGVLYAGVMLTEEGPKVLEFNCRFGDPETQPILMRMKSDLVPILEAAVDGRLEGVRIDWDLRSAVCVVMTSKGYPEAYEKGKEILGLEETSKMVGVVVFHAGTALKDNKIVTAGGRVLGVTTVGKDIREAVDRAYKAVEKITWDGAHYRKDIGAKAVRAS